MAIVRIYVSLLKGKGAIKKGRIGAVDSPYFWWISPEKR
jgi:hypothetical protein